MFKIVKNKTKQTQQIMFIGGSGSTVFPGDSLKINLKEISQDELERVMKFFVIKDGGKK